jgi:hypothetical protein
VTALADRTATALPGSEFPLGATVTEAGSPLTVTG